MADTSLAHSIRSLAETTGTSSKTVEFAIEMATVVTNDGAGDDRLPSAVAAGCLYAAAFALNSRSTANRSQSSAPTENRNWNPQVGHRRSDTHSTEMTISMAASITPASLRKHSREAAIAYLDSDDDSRERQRLSKLVLH